MTVPLSRRSFLAISAMLPWALRSDAATSTPVGLEMYSVREELQKDTERTVRAVAQMGYQCVEFYGPYFEWTEVQAKRMRKLLDDLGIRCLSTHNDEKNILPENIQRAGDMNLVLGSKYVIVAYAEPKDQDGWKAIADELNFAAEKLQPAGLKAGYHNHSAEFTPANGARPIEILAKNTQPSVTLQLDVGTCLAAGSDPVKWIRANPGRIRSIHCKDWSHDPAKLYKVLFGEGDADWRGIFAAAEDVGGVEYYLLEQEGSRFSEIETAKRCLQSFHEVHRS
jgi:sugar phosphate isomerase/epimerase